MSPSSVSATLVNTELPLLMVRIALGLVCSLVPGATPKKPYSGLTAHSRPSSPIRIQAMSSPSVSTFQPGMVGASMARLVLPQALGNAAATYLRDALGAGQLEDQHVLGEPALVARHHAGDAQGVALLAEQRVAAVAGAEGPDRPLLGELHDVLGVVARPRRRRPGRRLERHADRVQRRARSRAASSSSIRRSTLVPMRAITRIEAVTYAESVISTPNIGLLGLEVAHHERDDVHRPALHAARVEVAHDGLHLVRVHPVVGGPAVLLVDRADVGAVLDARDVGRVGGRVEGVRLLRPGRAG